MRLMRYWWIAVVVSGGSSLAWLLTAQTARPHYGGVLRVEMSDTGDTRFAGEINETLVRSNRHGEIEPWLATAWTHDAGAGKWIFAPRKNVLLQSGEMWTPNEGVLSIADNKPIEEILVESAQPEKAVAETGPFHVSNQKPSQFERLEANEKYWGGRPFLDAVEIQMGRPRRDQLLDFELGKADVVEAELTDIKSLRQRSAIVQVSKPLETVALVFENAAVSGDVRQALALSVDRSTMQRVLLDKQAEVSAALLPQWISGYSFLFPANRDLAHAKELMHGKTNLALCSDAGDRVLQPVADRIAVDAGQVDIVMHRSTGICDVRLVRLEVRSVNPQQALLSMALALHQPAPAWAPPYQMERELLKDYRVVPLFHFPLVHVLAPNVRNWSADWNLADVWLEATP